VPSPPRRRLRLRPNRSRRNGGDPPRGHRTGFWITACSTIPIVAPRPSRVSTRVKSKRHRDSRADAEPVFRGVYDRRGSVTSCLGPRAWARSPVHRAATSTTPRFDGFHGKDSSTTPSPTAAGRRRPPNLGGVRLARTDRPHRAGARTVGDFLINRAPRVPGHRPTLDSLNARIVRLGGRLLRRSPRHKFTATIDWGDGHRPRDDRTFGRWSRSSRAS